MFRFYNSWFYRPEQRQLSRPHSFHSDSPKLKRAVSLASPLDRRSKKSMLIRWCQLMTEDYDVSSSTSIYVYIRPFIDCMCPFFCLCIHLQVFYFLECRY